MKRAISELRQKVLVASTTGPSKGILRVQPLDDDLSDQFFTTALVSGISFASGNGGQWVTEDGGMVVLTGVSSRFGGSGGTVSAGNTTLMVNSLFVLPLWTMPGRLFGPDWRG
ncbi:MAG: hypothetical protein IPH00_16095 [Flavobacteriales bacterium]|nr:hypothetical protein [Flavobacteriales bacterium]